MSNAWPEKRPNVPSVSIHSTQRATTDWRRQHAAEKMVEMLGMVVNRLYDLGIAMTKKS